MSLSLEDVRRFAKIRFDPLGVTFLTVNDDDIKKEQAYHE